MNKKYIDFVPVRQQKVQRKPEVIIDPKPELVSPELISPERHFVAKKSELVEAKSKKVKASKEVRKTEKAVEKTVEKPVEKTAEIPKYPFINQEKVKKRPLSKNVYRKEIKTPVEEPKGPVTIISKPEKDAHASLIITIILTIILGAAAGTVAFLLLPK